MAKNKPVLRCFCTLCWLLVVMIIAGIVGFLIAWIAYPPVHTVARPGCELEERVLMRSLLNDGQDSSCPYGWYSYGDSCYYLNNTHVTWPEAEDFCQLRGGHLTSLQSPFEGCFIFKLIRSNFGTLDRHWLGFSNQNEAGNWTWADESQFQFPHLDIFHSQNETGNSNRDECVILNGIKMSFQNVSCFEKFGFVCKSVK